MVKKFKGTYLRWPGTALGHGHRPWVYEGIQSAMVRTNLRVYNQTIQESGPRHGLY